MITSRFKPFGFAHAMLCVVLLLAASSAHGLADVIHLEGVITAIEGDHVQIRDAAGKLVLVMVHKDTRYLKDGMPAARKDLKTGLRVAIDAAIDERMKMHSADEIRMSAASN